MGDLARTAACRFSISFLLALACLACTSAEASAGTFDIVACDTAPEGRHDSWVPAATDKMATAAYCPSAGREAAGLWAGNALNVGTIPMHATSQHKFEALPGTSIVYLGARYMFRRFDSPWLTGVFANGSMLHGCQPGVGPAVCSFNSQSLDRDSTWSWEPGQIRDVAAMTACVSVSGCRSDVA